MKRQIRRVSVMGTAKFSSALGAVNGLVLALLFQFLSDRLLIVSGGTMTLVTYPVFFALVGFIAGLAFGIAYNAIAASTGGLEVEVIDGQIR